jgi:hypothetical protein
MAGMQNSTASEPEGPDIPVVTVTQIVDPIVKCTSERRSGDRLHISCKAAGITVLNTTVPLPVVEVPVPVPGDTRTIKVEVPVPGEPTQTVTQRVEVPGPTETIRVPGKTKTIRPDAPTATVTENPNEGGQPGTNDGTMEPDNEPAVEIPGVNLTTPQAVGLSIGIILAMIGLIIIGMYSGFYMGEHSKEQSEKTFLSSLLNKDK